MQTSEKEKPKIEQVDPMDPTKKNSPVEEGQMAEDVAPEKVGVCYWNGATYSTGAVVSSGGRVYTCCWDGIWR